mgnify:CR=1 FL=1
MPKGKLLIIGGAEDKGPRRNPPLIKLKNRNYADYDILGRLIFKDDKHDNRIEIVTTASQQPLKTGRMYVRSFKRAGFANVGHISIENKEDLKNLLSDDYATAFSTALLTSISKYRDQMN